MTDDQWYRFLAARPEITEVNFWRPKDMRRFSALSGGEPFFFKTHSPQNRLVGGGIFAAFELLPVSLAWEIYREAKGVSSLEEMRSLITRYRDEPSTFPSFWHACCTFRLIPASHGIGPDPFPTTRAWSASGSGSEPSRLSC